MAYASPPRATVLPSTLSSHGVFFAHTERFVFDGSRVANPMNETVPQSRSPKRASPGSSPKRHNGKHGARLLHSAGASQHTQQAETTTQLSSTTAVRGSATMLNERARTATSYSYLAGDTRFELLKPSCREDVGPGAYYVEDGKPCMGTLPLDSMLRGAMPALDPWRPHQAFCASERPSIFKFSDAHYLGSYVSPEYQGIGTTSAPVEWSRSGDQRADVADYRYSARHKEADKELPDSDCTLQLDRAGKTLDLTASTSRACTVPFQTTQSRLALLPGGRLNDVRLGTQRLDDDRSARGPGSYLPLTSIGGAKRKTYRLYSLPAPGSPTILAASRSGPSSVAFTSITRAHKFSPSSPSRDSTLRR